jgi:hypothetical protein
MKSEWFVWIFWTTFCRNDWNSLKLNILNVDVGMGDRLIDDSLLSTIGINLIFSGFASISSFRYWISSWSYTMRRTSFEKYSIITTNVIKVAEDAIWVKI